MQLDDINSSSNEVDAYNISNVSVSGNSVTWDHVWVSDSGDRFCQSGHEAVAENGKFTSWAWPAGGADCPWPHLAHKAADMGSRASRIHSSFRERCDR